MDERLIQAACPDAELAKLLSAQAASKMSRIFGSGTKWVNYILTTANTWKTPISDFELIVERSEYDIASFCWDGPVEKIGRTTFRAAVKDFVPKRELMVYFFPNDRPPRRRP